MKYNRLELAQIIYSQTLNSTSTKQLAQEIAAFLLNNNLTDQLDSIIRDVKLIRQQNGILDVKVISRFPLNQLMLSNINNLLKQYYNNVKEILIEQIIDINLIGGVRLEMADSSLDLSMSNQLKSLLSLTKQKRI
jgi:F0F1-type ATP synthase delta subunit